VKLDPDKIELMDSKTVRSPPKQKSLHNTGDNKQSIGDSRVLKKSGSYGNGLFSYHLNDSGIALRKPPKPALAK
jgi:hypothetical protein